MATNRKKTTKSKSTSKSKKYGVISSSKKFSLSRGHKALLFSVALIAVIGIGAYGYNGYRSYRAQATAFQYVGTHPQADVETTDKAQQITALTSWNGKIYSGYGDWERNTGPMAVSPFDPATGKIAATPEFTAETEAVEIFKVINNKLYALHVDPRGGWGATYSVADASTGTTVWKNVTGKIPYTHTFGITQGLTANEIFISGQSDEGSGSNEVAKVYRSTDNGETWSQSLSIPSRGGFNRMMFIGKVNGKIYAQNMSMADFNGADPQSKAWVFNGSSWSSTTPIQALMAYDGNEFGGKLVLRSNPSGGSLLSFDGRNTTTIRSSIIDYTIGADGYIYSLSWEGFNSSKKLVVRSKDMTTWENVTYAPQDASTITYLNNSLYVGTFESELYKAVIDPNVIDSTPPTVSLLSPANGTTVGPNYSLLAANASDSSGITKVEFYVDSYLVGQTSSDEWIMHSDGVTNPYTGSYGVRWNGLGVPAGAHQLKAIAYDTYGNTRSSSSVTVNVPAGLTPPDNTAPTVTITSPTTETRNIRKSVTIRGTATDNSTLAYTEIMLDGKIVAAQYSTSGTITSPTVSIIKGNHTVVITAKDNAGNVSQATRTFSSK
ncbi:MAG: Ig-like domain-containing protein [Patescibacteria group bacterium]